MKNSARLRDLLKVHSKSHLPLMTVQHSSWLSSTGLKRLTLHENGLQNPGTSSAAVLSWNTLGKTVRYMEVSRRLPANSTHGEAEERDCIDQFGPVAPTGSLPATCQHFIKSFTVQIFLEHWVLPKERISISEATPLLKQDCLLYACSVICPECWVQLSKSGVSCLPE